MKVLDIKPKNARFFLRDPVTQDVLQTEDGVDIHWHVVGQDSVEYMEAQEALLKRLQDRKDEADKLAARDYKVEAGIQLAHLVKGWDEEFDSAMGGPFSEEYVAELLSNPDYTWIQEQLDAFVRTRRNFFLR